MKRTYLLFYVMLLFSHTDAQNYIPFPDSNAVWRVDFFDAGCSGYCYSFIYALSGDTTIGLYTYYKIEQTSDSIIYSYRGAIRQDTLLRQVYFIPPFNVTDTLLFDYSLSVNDTFESYI